MRVRGLFRVVYTQNSKTKMATKIVSTKSVDFNTLKNASDKTQNSFPYSGGDIVAKVEKSTNTAKFEPQIVCDTLDFNGRQAESYCILIDGAKIPLALFRTKQSVNAAGEVVELAGAFPKTMRLDDIYTALQEKAEKGAFNIVCVERQIIYRNDSGRDYVSRLVSLVLQEPKQDTK